MQKKSDVFKVLKEKRNNVESALNDAIAIEYVKSRRGDNCNSFADVKCWFLHNSYGSFYHDPGGNVATRTSIGAPELLTMLWMANPSQVDSMKLSRVGLTSYVTKYIEQHLPSDNTLKSLQKRAIRAKEAGDINERDFYNLCTRMSEGSLTQEDINNLEQSSDKEFSIYMAQQTIEYDKLREAAINSINADKEHQKQRQQYNNLNNKKKGLIATLDELREELGQLDKNRKQSFKNREPKLVWGVFVILLVFVFINYLDIFHIALFKAITNVSMILIPFIGTLAIHLQSQEEKRRQIAYTKWENKNSRYAELKRLIESSTQELSDIEDQLNSVFLI